MKKLILSASLMLSTMAFSQDAFTTFSFLLDCASTGDKIPAISHFEKTVNPLLPIAKNKFANIYTWGTTECRITDDGIMILLPNKERFDEMKEFLNGVYGVPEVTDDKDTKIKSYMYDYMQLADTHLNKEFTDGGINYYVFSVYIE